MSKPLFGVQGRLPVVIGCAIVVLAGVAWAAGPFDSDSPPEPQDEVGVAVSSVPPGEPRASGSLQEGRAWSAIKPALVAAYLRHEAAPGGDNAGVGTLSHRERRLIARALRRSDNDAASALFWRMADSRDEPQTASARIESVLADTGVDVSVPTEFGTTVWTLSEGVRFFSALAAGCLLPAEATDFVLEEMRNVTANQRWGIPTALASGPSVAVKAGWGPDPDESGRWLVEQFAIFERPEPAAIGIMARSRRAARSLTDDTAFVAGTQMIEDHAETALDLAHAPLTEGACP